MTATVTQPSLSAAPRIDGYAPLRDYAAIGDGRTVGLVARDGSIDWLPLPDLDSPTVFAAILDAERGGRFLLEPEIPYEVERRYLPGTNVLETTFHTGRGSVRVTDAVTLPAGLGPLRELQRRVEGISGTVPMRWRVEPRFGFGRWRTRIGRRVGVPIAESPGIAAAFPSFGAGEADADSESVSGGFVAREGSRAVLALCAAHQEPLVIPARRELDTRFAATCAAWRRWTAGRDYDGPWGDAVLRSGLALKLLVHAPSGAVAAAATTSLPEELGGVRNWDYRFAWIRDSAFSVDAFLALGCPEETHAYFWWLMHATQLTFPRLRVLYRLDGGVRTSERELPLAGYRGSRPVRVGNGAAEQLQLDTYGELLQTAWLYARSGHRIDGDVAKRLAGLADVVCEMWRCPDAGIWEVRSDPRHFTQSKMMCCIALERAAALAERKILPAGGVERWRREAAAIREFVETRCYLARKRSYARAADGEDLDAAALLGLLHGYADPAGARGRGTIDAIARELGRGAFVERYSGADGLRGSEGAFLACSFWLCDALAQAGRVDEAGERFQSLVDAANDVGLYSEEIDPASGDFLGNLPQGLSHLALIRAAASIAAAQAR